jgi:hypothetical protein
MRGVLRGLVAGLVACCALVGVMVLASASALAAAPAVVSEPPKIEGQSVSGVGSTGATLEATVNPDYQKTTYVFEYSTSKTLTGAKKIAGSGDLEGGGGQAASVVVSALNAGEVYYYRVVAENETSKTEGKPVYGSIQSFTTIPVPFTDAPTPSSGMAARFEGHFTLDPVATKWYFDYKAGDECVGESSTPATEAGSGSSEVTEAWEGPSGEEAPLRPNTEYTVCFVTSNAYGSQVGSPEHFTTLTAPPTIVSESATGETGTSVMLQATINPNLQATTYYFEYANAEADLGTTDAGKIPDADSLPEELKELQVSTQVGAPEQGKIYYYRVVAENESTLKEGKPADGPIQTYALPTLENGEAQNITQTAATLSGSINPQAQKQHTTSSTRTRRLMRGPEKETPKKKPTPTSKEKRRPPSTLARAPNHKTLQLSLSADYYQAKPIITR